MVKTSALILGLSAAAGLLAALPAFAQTRPGAAKPPPSFSNKPPKSPSGAANTPISEEDETDAIMGDTLSRIDTQVDAHYHKGEWNHSINLYKLIEQGDPHNCEAYSVAAYLLWSTDRNDMAIEQLKQGIAANPNISYMYDEMGTHYWLSMRDAKAAVPYYEKAIQFPCGWTTYHNLAFCYQKLGQWDKAVTAWRQATKFGDDVRAPALLKRAQEHVASQGNH